MAKITLIPTPQFNQQLSIGVRSDIKNRIIGRALLKGNTIVSSVGNMLADLLDNNDVIKSLRGNGSVDLAAHFGLTDSQSNGLADGMISLVRKSVKFIFNNQSDIIIGIRAVPSDFTEFLSLPGAEYVSKSSNIVIPVLRWLLIDPDIDIGAAAFDIVFSGDFSGKFDTTINKVSRSGRAVMIELQKLGKNTGYILPDIIRGNFGENFIEFALGQEQVRLNAANILMENIR